MRKVTVHLNSTLPHFSQLLAGLELLHSHKTVDLSYNFDPGKYPVNFFNIEIGGRNVFFDLADSSRINLSLYNNCDFYVKRMLQKSDFNHLERLIPYGLYYPVYFNNRYLRNLFLKNISYWKYSLKYWHFPSRILKLKDSIGTNHLRRMNSKPANEKQVIFRSRLWDAGGRHPEWKREKRRILNDERIKMNRILQQKFGIHYTGGIRKDHYSEKICPDLLISGKEFHRNNYLLELKRSSLGIISRGLEESIGAKFGEYLAFGMAVVTNPVNKFQFLGPLKEGKHYLEYQSLEECREKTIFLYSQDSIRREMQQANYDYYQNWLHPGVKLHKIIQMIEQK